MQPQGEGVWHLRGADLRLPGGVRLPLSSSLARLGDGGLLLYAPADLDDATWRQIATHGPVTRIVAPNLLHHLFLTRALERCPQATLHGPAALAAKRPDLPALHPTGPASGDWPDDLAAIALDGAPALEETVLFHRRSGTLLCGDLLFHVTAPAGVATRLVLALMGTGGGRLAQSRAWRFLVRDRGALRAALDRVLALPITRVLPCHGAAATVDAAMLAAALRRAYGGVPPVAR